MTAEEVEEAILRLPPAELAKFRAWFADFEAGRVKEPEGTANRLGRLAGRAFADIRKRMREP
jgi:predicted transcriptional regulator